MEPGEPPSPISEGLWGILTNKSGLLFLGVGGLVGLKFLDNFMLASCLFARWVDGGSGHVRSFG